MNYWGFGGGEKNMVGEGEKDIIGEEEEDVIGEGEKDTVGEYVCFVELDAIRRFTAVLVF